MQNGSSVANAPACSQSLCELVIIAANICKNQPSYNLHNKNMRTCNLQSSFLISSIAYKSNSQSIGKYFLLCLSTLTNNFLHFWLGSIMDTTMIFYGGLTRHKTLLAKSSMTKGTTHEGTQSQSLHASSITNPTIITHLTQVTDVSSLIIIPCS